jgi:hypothetical protein
MSKMVAPQMAAVNRDGCGVLNSNEPRWGSDQPFFGELAFPAKVDSCTEERTANEQDPIRFK